MQDNLNCTTETNDRNIGVQEKSGEMGGIYIMGTLNVVPGVKSVTIERLLLPNLLNMHVKTAFYAERKAARMNAEIINGVVS